MVTYGFYNSINHDRVYDATQMSQIFDGIIEPGVYANVGARFEVTKVENFQVRVGTGRAWFNHTWTYNDAPLILTLPNPPTLDNYYRSDAIVLDINTDINVRENKITYVKGTEVADNPSPPHPDLPSSGAHIQKPLAYIKREGNELEINAANIQCVVGLAPCPFVTSPNQSIDLTLYVNQWKVAWEQWFSTNTDIWDADLAAAEAAINTSVSNVAQKETTAKTSINEYVAEFQVWINSQKSQFDGWMEDSEDDFNAWFANLRYILDGDVAGHLQNEIDVINNRIVPIEKGGTGNSHGHIQTGYHPTSIFDTPLGEFATAEGMNTAATASAAHAEGGGQYTCQHHDAGIYGDRILETGVNSEYTHMYPYGTGWEVDITGDGSDIQLSSIDELMENSVVLDANDKYFQGGSSDYTGSTVINSFYIAAILKNETTGEILKHDIGCLGSVDASLKSNYIGHITSIGDFNANAFKAYNNQSITPIDKGWLKTKYGIGYGKVTSYIESLSGTGVNRTGHKSEAPGVSGKKGLAIYIGDTILLKYNIKEKDESGDIVLDDIIGYGTLIGIPMLFKLSVTLTYTFNSSTGKYKWNGNIETDYSLWYNTTEYSNTQGPTVYLVWQNNEWTEEELIPIPNSGQEYWYMNGDSLETSSIIIPGTMSVGISRVNSGDYTGAPNISFGYGQDHYNKVSDIRPFIILKNKSDAYSLCFYYSYSINDEPDYPIKWQEAGDTIIPSGYPTRATGIGSHAEGHCTKAAGDYSHAEGYANAQYSDDTRNPGAYGEASHIEGYGTRANGNFSHAEGNETLAGAVYSHAEGSETQAISTGAHAEGLRTIAGYDESQGAILNKGYASHAEGVDTVASGFGSHAEGRNSIAFGDYSHAGAGGIAGLLGQFVHGKFGFGGHEIEISTSKSITFSDTDHDYYLNGCAFSITSNNWLRIETNRNSQDTSARMLIVAMMDANDAEIDIIQFLNNDSVAPRKISVVRNGTALTNFPTLEAIYDNVSGAIYFPPGSTKRWVQIIRVI